MALLAFSTIARLLKEGGENNSEWEDSCFHEGLAWAKVLSAKNKDVSALLGDPELLYAR